MGMIVTEGQVLLFGKVRCSINTTFGGNDRPLTYTNISGLWNSHYACDDLQ